MDYHKKYIKYKNKYLNLRGGSNDDIVNNTYSLNSIIQTQEDELNKLNANNIQNYIEIQKKLLEKQKFILKNYKLFNKVFIYDELKKKSKGETGELDDVDDSKSIINEDQIVHPDSKSVINEDQIVHPDTKKSDVHTHQTHHEPPGDYSNEIHH